MTTISFLRWRVLGNLKAVAEGNHCISHMLQVLNAAKASKTSHLLKEKGWMRELQMMQLVFGVCPFRELLKAVSLPLNAWKARELRHS